MVKTAEFSNSFLKTLKKLDKSKDKTTTFRSNYWCSIKRQSEAAMEVEDW